VATWQHYLTGEKCVRLYFEVMIICVAIPVFLFTTQDFRMKEKKRPVLTFLSLRNILLEHFSFEHQVNYSKFPPPPVESCWQNKNISKPKLGIVNNQRWQYNYFINMIGKQLNLLDAKTKNALVKCFEEIDSKILSCKNGN
jgi:hypothetical protein